MKKEAKVEFGITITKPWSKEMYAHNDALAVVVEAKVLEMWISLMNQFQADLGEVFMSDVEWCSASLEMVKIQKAITCYGFGYGYTMSNVSNKVMQTLAEAELYQLKQLVEELDIELETGFIGFN